MKKKIENIFYVIVGIAWTAYFVKLSRALLGTEVDVELLAIICGSSIGVLICWAIMYFTMELRRSIK
jgi:hypothetical protein